MDDRATWILLSLTLIALAFGVMHNAHYKQRRGKLLAARVAALEEIATSDPELRPRLLEARVAALEAILLEDRDT
jgi:hypothetical protein